MPGDAVGEAGVGAGGAEPVPVAVLELELELELGLGLVGEEMSLPSAVVLLVVSLLAVAERLCMIL